MVAKTRLLLWDFSYLLFWIFSLVMMLLNIWNWLIWVLVFGFLILITNTVFRPPIHKLGKAKAFALFSILIVWIIAGIIVKALSLEIDSYDVQLWPGWLKLVFIVILLAFATIFVCKVCQDLKFSEEREQQR